MPTDLAQWRQSRQETHTLRCGLVVTLRRVDILDLAAGGRIPTPLLNLASVLLETDRVVTDDLAQLKEYADLVNVVVIAVMVDPPAAAEASDTHVGVEEIPFPDRQWIYNWAHGEVAPLARFSEQPAQPQGAVGDESGVPLPAERPAEP